MLRNVGVAGLGRADPRWACCAVSESRVDPVLPAGRPERFGRVLSDSLLCCTQAGSGCWWRIKGQTAGLPVRLVEWAQEWPIMMVNHDGLTLHRGSSAWTLLDHGLTTF